MANIFHSLRDNASFESSGIGTTTQWRARRGTYNLYKEEKKINTSFTKIQPKPKLISRNISHGDIRAHIRRNPEVPGLKFNFTDDYEVGVNKSALYDHKHDLKQQKQTYKPLRRQYEQFSVIQYDQPLKSNRYTANPRPSQNKYTSSQLDGLKVERKPYLKPYINSSPTKSPGKIVQVKNKVETMNNKNTTPQIKQFSLGQKYSFHDKIEKKELTLTQNGSFSNLHYQRQKRPIQSNNEKKADLFDRLENYERKFKQRQANNTVNYRRFDGENNFQSKRQYLRPSQPVGSFRNTLQDKYSLQNEIKESLKVRDQNLQNTSLRRNIQKERILMEKDSKKYDVQNLYINKDRNSSSYNLSNYPSLTEKAIKNTGITPTKLKYKQNDRKSQIYGLNQKQRGFNNYSKDKKVTYQKSQYERWNNYQNQSHQDRFTRLNDYENRLYDQPKRHRIQSTTDLKVPHKYPYIQGMNTSNIYGKQRPQYQEYVRETFKKPLEIGLKNNLLRRQQSHEISVINHPEYNCVNRIEALNNKINKFNISCYQH